MFCYFVLARSFVMIFCIYFTYSVQVWVEVIGSIQFFLQETL